MKPLGTRIARQIAALAVVVSCVLAAPAGAQGAERLIVGFTPEATVADQVGELREAGVDNASAASVRATDVPALDLATVTVAAGDVAGVRAELLTASNVEFVEVDHRATAAWMPNDPRMPEQWHLGTLGLPTAWDTSRGAGIKIAVVDTGVSYIHPELMGKVELGRDFVDGDNDPMDEQGHGTHVAGAAAGLTDNASGIAGVAPNARILAVRVLDQDGSGYYSWIAGGIVFAADNGAKVINLSLGGNEGSAALEQAVNYAAAKGAIVTCASGNDGAQEVGYPARYDGCLSVGATTPQDGIAGFSNQGAGLDISAPGVDILSTVRGGGHEAWSGTSMATPLVSGTAALLSAKGLSRAQVLTALTTTATDLGAPGLDTQFGNGRLNTSAAVAAAAALQIPPADPTAPVVSAVSVTGGSAAAAATTTTWKWKQVKVTKWKVVGRSQAAGRYVWTKRRKGSKANVRTIDQYRMRRGLVSRRTVTERRVPVRRTSPKGGGTRLVTITASDNVGVDRVGLQVDGVFVATDWTAADGWAISWPCSSGPHTFTALAFDAADNQHSLPVTQTVNC